MDYTTLIVLLGVIGGLILFVFVVSGVYLIHESQVGVVTRKLLGKRMPPGQVIARHGEVGVQAATLVPGLYFRSPIIWSVAKTPIIEVGPDSIATIEAIDGKALAAGRRLR